MTTSCPGDEPRVSVVIPTWNGGPRLRTVLEAVLGQETPFPFEVLCVDSSSTDGTADLLREHAARDPRLRVITIPKAEFDHGLTRNLGIRESRGEIVVLLVQDAVPASRDWMVTLASSFDDPAVAGAYCHQIPRDDCSPLLRERLKDWMPGDRPIVNSVSSPEAFEALSPPQRYRMIAFDDVASAVRRSRALEHPFQRRRFGEDVTWARGAILRGWKIVLDPRARVIHSHNNSIFYEFRRAYLDHQNLHDLAGVHFCPTLRSVLENSARLARRLYPAVRFDPSLGALPRWLWIARIPWFAFTQNLAQFLGPLSNRMGRRGLWRIFDRIIGRNI